MNEQAKVRIGASIVSVFGCDEPSPGNYDVRSTSTGVLVRLAGVDFAFASAHGIWDTERRDFLPMVEVYGGERKRRSTLTLGGGSVLRGYVPKSIDDEGYPEPDVALLELTDRAILRSARRPFEESEIGFLPPDGPRQILLLAGFPGEDPVPDAGLPKYEMTPVVLELASLAHGTDGMHRRFAQAQIEYELADVEGVSGGPLVLPNGAGTLVGLLRQVKERDEDCSLQCEPVLEAVRALVHPDGVAAHRNAQLRDAAERILARCS